MSEISEEQMLSVMDELEDFKAWDWTVDEQKGFNAIRRLIESSGERPCATVPKLSITHGDDGYWLCIDSPSGKHAGIHLEKRPEMTIVNAVLAEVAIELAGGEQEDPKEPGPTVEPGPCKSTEEGSTPSPGFTDEEALGRMQMAIEDAELRRLSVAAYEMDVHKPQPWQIMKQDEAALAHLTARLAQPAPLPEEVKEAMITLHEAAYDGYCFKYHVAAGGWWSGVLKAEAVIKAALESARPNYAEGVKPAPPTIKENLTVAAPESEHAAIVRPIVISNFKESLTIEPEVDNSDHLRAKERDRLDKFLITMMCHVKEVYEANGTPWREDDEERFVAIRSRLSAPPQPAKVSREQIDQWARHFPGSHCVALAILQSILVDELGIAVADDGEG